jgi:two-component system LytT family response regulator
MVPSSESMRVLVVDDEAPARKRLAEMLEKDRDVGGILEAQNGMAAVAKIQEERPDVVFLDVQMPGVDGFGVIGALGAANMPLTVFVTGYDQFALRAFDNNAIDYLLKPFRDTRYEETMARVKTRLREVRAGLATPADSLGLELIQLASRRATPGEIWQWIAVKSRVGTRLVMADDIDWIEGAGVYVTLHVGSNEFVHRASLAVMASRLDPFQFVRIHKSSVVNVRSIECLERRSHGEFEIVLKNGARLMLSRSYRANVERMLGQSL